MTRSLPTNRIPVVVAVLLLALLPILPVNEYWITQLNFIGIATLVVLGLVLLTGVAGLTSFGQAAFVGIGAYSTGYLCVVQHLSPWLGLLLGLAVTVVFAGALGLLTLNLSGHFLPLGTIAWGVSLYFVFGNTQALGKYDGLVGLPPISIGAFALDTGRSFYYFLWGIVLLSAVALSCLLNSRTGRALRALKDGTAMPEAMGINTFRTKLIAFLLAALLASIAGWFLAHYQRTVDPSVSSLRASIGYLFMAVIGGVSSIGGAFAGAASTQILDDRLQVWLPKLTGSEGHYEIIVFGILLVLLLQSANRGLFGLLAGWATRRPRSVTPDALPRSCRPTSQGPLLQVRGLTKQFTGLTAVDGIDFDVHAGEIVGLIGPNGAGKSTTFNLITGALPPTSGTVTLNGRSVTGWSARAIAHEGLARSFQHVRMVPEMTVLENVALGAHRHGRAGVVAAVLGLDKKEEQVLLNDAAAHLARVGLAAQMHEPAGNLSLGSQRLLEIARALSTAPALLLLDEPAAGLRHAEKLALAEVLRALRAQGIAILLVEHDMDLVMNVTNRIVVMEFGRLLLSGTPREVQASPAVRAAYLGTEV
jgi:branched-chain amino acid transport system ATP-binding protein/branched-chain amino acid transport system permease protein